MTTTDSGRARSMTPDLSTFLPRAPRNTPRSAMLTSVNTEIARILDRQLVIAGREHPRLFAALRQQAATGELQAILPGVFTAPDRAQDVATRAAAACRYDRSAVITGDAAAALAYWSELQPDQIVVAGRQHRLRQPGYQFVRRAIPPSLVRVRQGIRYTAPELTALDQIEQHGGGGIDRALRSRRTTIAQMRVALDATPNRRGNQHRRATLLDSRDAPWSELERRAHRVLREAGITGWSANVEVETAVGEYIVDIVFHHSPLCIELDGRTYHGPAKFDEDRLRGNELLLAGKLVLRFSWNMVRNHPQMVVSAVRRALDRDGAGGPRAEA